MFAPTPHDVLSQYRDVYGDDGLFPVADTPLGRLACVAPEEILYPEVARALATHGAELILHSSSEVGSPRATPKNIATCARASENMCCVISSNTSAIHNSPLPQNSTQGHALIDIERLREARCKPATTNLLARQRLSLFRSIYDQPHFYPEDNLVDEEGAVTVADRTRRWKGYSCSIMKSSIPNVSTRCLARFVPVN